MYHTLTVQVKQKDRLYKWCDTNAHLANNLYNAALFGQRQMMSASKKEANSLTPNELEILDEVKLLENKTNRKISTSGIMSYTYLDALLKYTKNNDYYAEGLPIHVAQNVLKEVCGAIKGYFGSLNLINLILPLLKVSLSFLDISVRKVQALLNHLILNATFIKPKEVIIIVAFLRQKRLFI